MLAAVWHPDVMENFHSSGATCRSRVVQFSRARCRAGIKHLRSTHGDAVINSEVHSKFSISSCQAWCAADRVPLSLTRIGVKLGGSQAVSFLVYPSLTAKHERHGDFLIPSLRIRKKRNSHAESACLEVHLVDVCTIVRTERLDAILKIRIGLSLACSARENEDENDF